MGTYKKGGPEPLAAGGLPEGPSTALACRASRCITGCVTGRLLSAEHRPGASQAFRGAAREPAWQVGLREARRCAGTRHVRAGPGARGLAWAQTGRPQCLAARGMWDWGDRMRSTSGCAAHDSSCWEGQNGEREARNHQAAEKSRGPGTAWRELHRPHAPQGLSAGVGGRPRGLQAGPGGPLSTPSRTPVWHGRTHRTSNNR